MNRLRSTFKRSRTPTGSEMKAQSSLEVPKQVRSASFDEMALQRQRQQQHQQPDAQPSTSSHLSVPQQQQQQQRSLSVDCSGAVAHEEPPKRLDVPKRYLIYIYESKPTL